MSEEPVGGARIIAGRYELTRQLEPGGTTWAATDTSPDQPGGAQVALREFTVPQGTSDDDRRALISQATWEACQLAQLRDNPNVLRFHGAVEEDGRLWIVTELLSAPDVGRIVAGSGPLPAAEAGRIGAAVLGALAASHSLGVVHRAVRPGNIVRGEDGRVVLTGFDVAPAQSFPAPAELDFTDPHRLRTGQATFAGDVFSLGSTLYYLVEGVAPFYRPDPQAQAIAISSEEPPQPLRAGPIGAVMYTLLRKNQAEIPAPAIAQAQMNAALGVGSPLAAPAQQPGLAQSGLAQPGLAQTGQTQFVPTQPAAAQPGPMFIDPGQFDQIQAGQTFAGAIPTGPVGLPAGPARPSAASRTLWLLTALASAVATGAAFMTSWGTIVYKFPGNPAQTYTGSLIKIIKSGAGGPGTDPAPAVIAWLVPLLLPLLGTIVLGVIAAASRRRLGWLCLGSALLGLASELGAYWWTADIGAPSSLLLPSVSLHVWGYVGIAASGVAFLLAAAAGVAGRSQTPAPDQASAPGVSASPLKTAARIVAAVGAVLTAAALFLPFYGYGVGHDQTKMNAWQWSQDTVPAIGVCLIAVLVLALLSLSPSRRITTAQLIVPAAVALLLEGMMPLQVIGLEALFTNGNKNTLYFGAWVGLGLSLVVLIATALSHRKSAAAAPSYGPYGMPPGQGLPIAPQTMMVGQHGYPYVPPRQGPTTTA